MSTTIKNIYAFMMGTIKTEFWKNWKTKHDKNKRTLTVSMSCSCNFIKAFDVSQTSVLLTENSWNRKRNPADSSLSLICSSRKWSVTCTSWVETQRWTCSPPKTLSIHSRTPNKTLTHTCAKCAHHFKFSLKNVYAVKSRSQDIFNLPNSYIKDQKQEDIPLMSKYL